MSGRHEAIITQNYLGLKYISFTCVSEHMDPNLHRHLSEIEEKLDAIKKGPRALRSFGLGVVSGAGYVIGGILVIFVIGFILNALGVIPGLGSFADLVGNAVEKSGYR